MGVGGGWGGGDLKWNDIVYRLPTAHITQMHERESNKQNEAKQEQKTKTKQNKNKQKTKTKQTTTKSKQKKKETIILTMWRGVCSCASQMIVIIGDSGDCGYVPCYTYDVNRALLTPILC